MVGGAAYLLPYPQCSQIWKLLCKETAAHCARSISTCRALQVRASSLRVCANVYCIITAPTRHHRCMYSMRKVGIKGVANGRRRRWIKRGSLVHWSFFHPLKFCTVAFKSLTQTRPTLPPLDRTDVAEVISLQLHTSQTWVIIIEPSFPCCQYAFPA